MSTFLRIMTVSSYFMLVSGLRDKNSWELSSMPWRQPAPLAAGRVVFGRPTQRFGNKRYSSSIEVLGVTCNNLTDEIDCSALVGGGHDWASTIDK